MSIFRRTRRPKRWEITDRIVEKLPYSPLWKTGAEVVQDVQAWDRWPYGEEKKIGLIYTALQYGINQRRIVALGSIAAGNVAACMYARPGGSGGDGSSDDPQGPSTESIVMFEGPQIRVTITVPNNNL